MADGAHFPIPEGWALTSCMIAEQQVEEVDGVRFAGNLLVQLRLDVDVDADPKAVAEHDKGSLEKAFDGFTFLTGSPVSVASQELAALEYQIRDPNHGQDIQHLVLYVPSPRGVFSVTATQRPGDAFDRVRSAARSVAASLLAR